MKPSLWMLILLLFLSGCSTQAANPENVEIIVSAAISLQGPLNQIKKDYEQLHPETKITYNFGASGALQKQIEQGAPADLFISAGAKQMDVLAEKQLIDSTSRINLVANKLVLIVPAAGTGTINSFGDLSNAKLVAIGEPKTVPAGEYAKQVLTHEKVWDGLQDGKLSFAKDVKQVLAYVETGSVDAGLVYRTDVTPKVRVVAEAGDGSHKPIVYPLAVVAASSKKLEASKYVDYLRSQQAQEVFMTAGFGRVQGDTK